MGNDWVAFWANRGVPSLKPFYQNWGIFKEILHNHFDINGGDKFTGMKSLEVGSGRGIMSNLFQGVGFKTTTLDIFPQPNVDVMGNVFCLPFHKESFDVIFTYGLLEHFNLGRQAFILNKMREYLKPGGIQIHYIVPSKLTNMFEDRNVYRDQCNWLYQDKSVIWVYPPRILALINNKHKPWVTTPTLGKGAIYVETKHSGIDHCEDIIQTSPRKEFRRPGW